MSSTIRSLCLSVFIIGLFPMLSFGDQVTLKRFKFFGGMSYANIQVAGLQDRKNSLGWSATVTAKLNRYAGITFDFAGQYDPDCADNDEDCLVDLLLSEEIQNYSSYQFMVGPSFCIPNERFSPFVHALFGGVRTRSEILIIDTREQFIVSSGARFAMGFGGGLDWNIVPFMGMRIIQFDYIPVDESDSWRNNVRIQGGVLFRL